MLKDKFLAAGRDALKPASKHTNSLLPSFSLPSKQKIQTRDLFEAACPSASAEELAEFKTFRSQRDMIRNCNSSVLSEISKNNFDRSDCGEFHEENFNYMQDRELTVFPLTKNFIELKGHDITSRMRYAIINWLVDVHKSFQLTPESLFLTVAVMDRYIHRTSIKIKKESIQLLALTALYVSAKFEEIFPPEISEIAGLCEDNITKEHIKEAEKDILKTLNFTLSFPSPIVFLRRLTSALGSDHGAHSLAKYLLELSIAEYDLAHLTGNKRASIAVCLAQALSTQCGDLSKIWVDGMVYLTGLKLEDIVDDLRVLARAVYRQNSPSRYRAIKNKYTDTESLGRVAELPILRSVLLENIGGIEFDN
ncbi:G2/mitotic-specific cyclin-B2 [Cichlidogyrus casuarinus]|uniref:G2/mitotic-specific cyclin-B2 n=1 Tax=Cichlidogyrus casuarinus TaxID=1844966 RepID=A0ABD2Q064_9PLAT